jgi:hypothetical protein
LLDYSIDAPLENVIFRRAYEIATSIPTAKSLCLKVSVRAQDHYGKPLLVDMGGYDFDTADLRELRQYASADALMNDLSNIANNSETFIHFLLPFDIEGILLVSDPRKIDETNRPQCGMWSPNLPEESHAAEMAAPSTASAAPASNRSSNAVSVSDRTDAMNAADTVRAFYFALGTGDGDHANMLMALEKRASPAYQPEAIDAFYGHMAEPLTLVSIDATGPTEYAVRYRYRKQSSLCDGRAVVTTTESDGHFLISKIRPLGNC